MGEGGGIQVLRNAFSWKFDMHPPPRNANKVEQYTFILPLLTPPPPPPIALHLNGLFWQIYDNW